MILKRCGSPLCWWYWRTTLNAVSLASEPEFAYSAGAAAAEQLVEPLAQRDGRQVAAGQRVEGEPLELLGRRLREPPAPVADVHAPLAAQAVEVAARRRRRSPTRRRPRRSPAVRRRRRAAARSSDARHGGGPSRSRAALSVAVDTSSSFPRRPAPGGPGVGRYCPGRGPCGRRSATCRSRREGHAGGAPRGGCARAGGRPGRGAPPPARAARPAR